VNLCLTIFRRKDLYILILFGFINDISIGSDGFAGQIILIYLTSERSEPSSRNFLNGEQPYPWDLLQPQDKLSRHRGAEHCRRYGLLGSTSLLSPE